jgi:hypothetical protein
MPEPIGRDAGRRRRCAGGYGTNVSVLTVISLLTDPLTETDVLLEVPPDVSVLDDDSLVVGSAVSGPSGGGGDSVATSSSLLGGS